MSDGSRDMDFTAHDPLLQGAGSISETSYSDSKHDAQPNLLYLYVPASKDNLVKRIMSKVGIPCRINDYRVQNWQVAQPICYLQFNKLNSFQKLLLDDARQQQAIVSHLIEYLEHYLGQIEVELLDPEYLLSMDVQISDNRRIGNRIKRILDIVLSSGMLLGLFPVGLVVAALVKLDSPGPVFFKQLRTGLYNREFEIVKFRSMKLNAEQNGARWAVKDDDRVTRIGRILRKTRLDELPQLLNVIKGDMSLVGPRPEREIFISQLENNIPFYRFRHLVKPGITGLAQVEYCYGASVDDARQKHRYDLYYIKHRGVGLDVKILLKTIAIVLGGKGT